MSTNKTLKTENGFYGKYLKTSTDKFGKQKAMFIVLKDKNFKMNNKYFTSQDGNTLTTLSSKLFDGLKLETNQVYFVKVNSMDTFNGFEYIKSVIVAKVPLPKAIKLTKENQIQHPKTITNEVELSDDE